MKTYYKSELAELEGKEFTDVKELEKAEAEVTAQKQLKAIEATKKKVELAKIEKAANDYFKLVTENTKKREELRQAERDAYQAYKKELDEFAEKHQGYHLTYRKNGDNIEFQIEEAKQQTLEDYYKSMNDMFKDFFSFWF